jgi:glycosyltransferase involved in cell wall biosynthesis
MLNQSLRVFSVLIPVLNEERCIPKLLIELSNMELKFNELLFEFIFIDDGSSDSTVSILRQFSETHPRVEILVFSRNFGHQAALFAGLSRVTGVAAIILDADLQDPPELIHEFIKAFDDGYDIVATRKISRRGGKVWRLCYASYYRLQKLLSDTEVVLDSGDFGLLSRRVVDIINSLSERNLYLRGLRSWTGFPQKIIDFHRPNRIEGKTKYSILKLLRLAADGIFSFSNLPLRASGALGLLVILVSAIFLIYNLYIKFFTNTAPTGFTAIITVVLFMSGVQLLSLGIIGEYLGRMYTEIKLRPRFLIKNEYRSNNN